MYGKGLGPQGLGTSKNRGYVVGEGSGCKCKGNCKCGESPMKKLKDLSGDGKVTQKDVLIGRGVIESPMKQIDPPGKYKEDTSRFDNFNMKSDTLVKGNSRDMATSKKIAIFNGRNFSTQYKDEKVFKEPNGSYSTMRTYKKDKSPAEQKSPLMLKDACYNKVKASYKVFPSAYASGAIAKCRKNS